MSVKRDQPIDKKKNSPHDAKNRKGKFHGCQILFTGVELFATTGAVIFPFPALFCSCASTCKRASLCYVNAEKNDNTLVN